MLSLPPHSLLIPQSLQNLQLCTQTYFALNTQKDVFGNKEHALLQQVVRITYNNNEGTYFGIQCILHIIHTQNIHKHSSKNYTVEKCLTDNGLNEWTMLSGLYPKHNLLILHSSLEEQDKVSFRPMLLGKCSLLYRVTEGLLTITKGLVFEGL